MLHNTIIILDAFILFNEDFYDMMPWPGSSEEYRETIVAPKVGPQDSLD